MRARAPDEKTWGGPAAGRPAPHVLPDSMFRYGHFDGSATQGFARRSTFVIGKSNPTTLNDDAKFAFVAHLVSF